VQFTRIVLGWLATGLVFLASDLLRARLTGARDRASARASFVEALPFTLLLALWMASLGGGMWWLVVLLLALAIEVPGRMADVTKGEPAARVAKRTFPALLRFLVAGMALRVIL